MNNDQPLFGVADYVVLSIVLIISSLIGIYYRFTGGKQKTVKVNSLILINHIVNKIN